VNETAAAIEEMSRSIAGVADNATDLAAATEETTSSINEMAASVEEVGAMTETLATAVEQNASAIRPDVPRRPVGRGERAGDQRCGGQRGHQRHPARSIHPIGRVASRQADEVTRRVSRDAEDGGSTIQRSIQGIGGCANRCGNPPVS
jgi:methyl-accepting chemotaxis protein